MSAANPPPIKVPRPFAKDPELFSYFAKELHPFLRLLFARTGGGDDFIANQQTKELFPWMDSDEVELFTASFNTESEPNSLPSFTSIPSLVDVLSVSANHTTAGDEIVIVTSNISVFLNPEPAELERVVIKRNTALGTVTVEGNGHTIDGAATYLQVINYESVTVIYIDTEWVII